MRETEDMSSVPAPSARKDLGEGRVIGDVPVAAFAVEAYLEFDNIVKIVGTGRTVDVDDVLVTCPNSHLDPILTVAG